jgi:ribonucleoside-diphosphate reductase beta chain
MPEAALTLREKQEILFATIFWFLCFEGIWFVMGLSGPIQNLARHGKFTGAAEQFQYILRDEFQHIRFGIHLINAYIEQYPECMSKSFVEAIGRLFEETIRLEDDYIRYCLPSPIIGYNADDHSETAKWYANQRAGSIGLPPVYEGAEHRFPWMSEQVSIRKEKNFFETRPTEYRTGGALSWDD